MKTIIATIALGAGLTAPLAANTVPMPVRTVASCQASLGQQVRAGSVIDFGELRELCSSGRGYRLVLTHPAGLGGARFVSGSKVVVLSYGSETVIADENGARRRSGPARIEFDRAPDRKAAFALAISPK